MNFGRLTIRHVACLGPSRKNAAVDFRRGPNAIIGLSDTGKSFVFELIDFMLGAEELKRELPEAAGYDTVVLGIETADKKLFTLRRSMSGGDMHVLDGLVKSRAGGQVLETLVATERKKGPRTINQFYLDLLGLAGMVLLSKKEKGATQRLSIRTLSKLVLVSETRIIEQQSPILSGQFTLATPEMSLFKLLVSGVDDSALISYASETKTVEARQDRLAAGRALVAERLKQLQAEGYDENALRSELAGFEETLAKLKQDTGNAEQELVAVRRRIRRLAESQDIAEQRKGELSGLLSRFALLDAHYQSDMGRLTAIAEAAEALDSLAPGPCPLCGAIAEAQNHARVCEADLPALAQSARAEADRIRKLHNDLSVTIARAQSEHLELEAKLSEIVRQLHAARSARTDAEQATRMQWAGYTEVVEQSNAVKDRLRAFGAIRDLESSIITMEQEAEEIAPQMPDVATPRANLDDFAKEVGAILQAWNVPGTERVFFDPKANDLQLDGKLRGSHGKGMRALTHAAFIIGLMIYCLKNGRPHPGFVVIDSPLLSYRGDEAEDDPAQDLKNTTVDTAFYRWLAKDLSAGQVIVIENRDAPKDVSKKIWIHQFMGASGDRYGFFPKN